MSFSRSLKLRGQAFFLTVQGSCHPVQPFKYLSKLLVEECAFCLGFATCPAIPKHSLPFSSWEECLSQKRKVETWPDTDPRTTAHLTSWHILPQPSIFPLLPQPCHPHSPSEKTCRSSRPTGQAGRCSWEALQLGAQVLSSGKLELESWFHHLPRQISLLVYTMGILTSNSQG